MANRIRTGDPRGFNKGRCSKFREGSQVRQTPEEGRRTYRPKCCGNKNKDEDNSPKTLNDKKNTLEEFKIYQLITTAQLQKRAIKKSKIKMGGGGCPGGVMVKAMDFGIVVCELKLQSRFYVHFRANTLRKGIEPPYPPSYGLNSTTTVLLGEWLWH